MNKRIILGITGLSLAFSVAGCSGRRFGEGWFEESEEGKAAAPAADKAKVEAMIKEADAAFAKRSEKEAAEKACELYAQAADLDPSNYHACAQAARACYVVADYHLPAEEDKDRRMELYTKGLTYGEKGMATDPKFKEKVLAGEAVEQAAQVLGKSHIDALYWAASNLGKWSVAQGFVTTLANKNKIKSLIERVAALDDAYFHGAAHRYLGTYYAKAPAFAGGDMNKSLEHYNRSLEYGPNYLGTRVLKAEFYCVKFQTKEEGDGKACFQQELDTVLKTASDVAPDILSENTMEKRKAEALLATINDRFAY